ncbi:bifunctional diguanylate cyclase/phosphodiesterase [Shewanella sp. WXL01]|uniref:putative bifunctional diguanylate cyclase/phosphodiesterase n=1 Tax=Shewanella sp. WXL01 TaxID=2709721 RepID=UPI001FD889E5|nr:EAL domain-containing protein [Shewanella sp. WXL01]
MLNRFPKISLSLLVPTFVVVLFTVIVTIQFFVERSQLQQDLAESKSEQITSSLFRMRHVVESALSNQDLERIEQEVSLVGTDVNMQVYALLDMSGEIHYANHVIWRESNAKSVLEGYQEQLHQNVVTNEQAFVDIDFERLEIQVYYPLNSNNRYSYSNTINLIYLEYGISGLVSSASDQLLARFVYVQASGLIAIIFFCLTLHWLLVKPLKRLSASARHVGEDSFDADFVSPSKEVADLRDYLKLVSGKLSRCNKRLNDAEQRWLFAVEGARNGIWDWDLVSGDVFISDRWKEILGYQAYELDNDYSVWESRLHPEDKPQVLLTLQNYINNKTDNYESVHRLRHKTGRYTWVLDRGKTVEWDSKGSPTRLIGSITDVTGDVKTQRLAPSKNASQSNLTDLIDRESLANELYDLQVYSRKAGQFSALLMINLNNFKLINDALGRQIGDRLLIQIAARLTGAFSHVGTVARLGSDEFVILARNFGGELEQANKRALALASEVRQLIGRSFSVSEQNLSISARVGIVVFEGIESLEPQTLLARADGALVQAKDSRSNGCAIYYPHYDENSRPFDLGHELKQALASEQISLVYQPVVDQAGRLHSLEALLRWYHPLHGFISPKKFIPIAELSDSIFELELLAIEQACHLIRELQQDEQQAPLISINISSRHFHQSHFVSMVVSKIQSKKVKLQNIQLELKGDIFSVNADEARLKLLELQRHGLKVALDDFGAGLCAFYQIQGIGFSQVKLSQHYLNNLESSTESINVLNGVVDLARQLSLPVVGKHIENKMQLHKLTQARCSYFQGYIISRPLNITDTKQLIQSQLSLSVVT